MSSGQNIREESQTGKGLEYNNKTLGNNSRRKPQTGFMSASSEIFRKVMYEMADAADDIPDGVDVRNQGTHVQNATGARIPKSHSDTDMKSASGESPRYLSCKRYPWVCVRNNCTHKHEYCVWYTPGGKPPEVAKKPDDKDIQPEVVSDSEF